VNSRKGSATARQRKSAAGGFAAHCRQHAGHGIRYSLTLHDKYGARVLGYDNAHAVRPPKKFKFSGQRLPYHHRHRTASDKGVPYAFESAYRLLEDLFAEVDRVMKEVKQ
jgi:hypothetical protein